MRLSVIYPIYNQHELATAAIDVALYNLSGETDVEFVLLDNGSETPFKYNLKYQPTEKLEVRIAHSESNIGVYPTFWWGLKESTGDILAFFHSDLIVSEKGWDKRIVEEFEKNEKLGLAGFIGSNEIDPAGGRGAGTCSNFQGNDYLHQTPHGLPGQGISWRGSPAEAHGRRITGSENAAVVDGCAMIFRRSALEMIPKRSSFPPHHFYDRLLSCEVQERGYKVEVMGIECDHISGQTANKEGGYQDMAQVWAQNHGLSLDGAPNWDYVIYKESERQWLKEYRDVKHFIPRKV